MAAKWGPVVGISEIAAMAQVSKQTVSNWRARADDFPEPVSELASGPVFQVEDIVVWLQRKADALKLCPVCLTGAERGRDGDYGERKQVRCPRCGPFVVTGTALAMLRSRINADPLARARLSHAIRQQTNEEDWLLITSMNLDALVSWPLPDVNGQLRLLAQWIAGQLRDDHFGTVGFSAENLTAVVGAVNADRVGRLLDHAAKIDLVTIEGDEIGLTPEGWKLVRGEEAKPARERAKPAWAAQIPDESLRNVLDEVYRAVKSGSLTLASMGARTLLDRAMVLRVGDVGGFAAKLDRMVDQRLISEHEREILEAVTDAGNASAHRAFAPSKEVLDTILDVTESFLHRHFVLANAAATVRSVTPSRNRRRQ